VNKIGDSVMFKSNRNIVVGTPSLWNQIVEDFDGKFTSFDSIFDSIWKSGFPNQSKVLGSDVFTKTAFPKVNVIEESDHVEIEAHLSGIKKEDVSVEISDGILTISGKNSEQDTSPSHSTKKYVIRELKKSSFSRSFTMTDNLEQDISKISAKFDNGILYITIPKIKNDEIKVEKPKQVKIQ
jgi:HSP20 family protein